MPPRPRYRKKRKRSRSSNVIDMTDVVTCAATAFMVYRIFVLLQKVLLSPPRLSLYTALQQQELTDYSKLPAIRASSGRNFLKYVPSPWESQWSTFVDDLVRTDTVCHQIALDAELIKSFFNSTCSGYFIENITQSNQQGWCVMDDTQLPLFFNVKSGKVGGARPSAIQAAPYPQLQPLRVKDDKVFSKLIYQRRDHDDKTIQIDYIEPLVNRLRYPLDCCEHAYPYGANFKKPPPNCKATKRLGVFRGHYIPMEIHDADFEKFHYFDVGGTTDWKRARSSLTYVTQVWQRHKILFDWIHIYEATIPLDKFLKNVPPAETAKLDYRLENTTLDIVQEIVSQTLPNDYVVWKLDLPDHAKEMKIWEELLDNRLDILNHVDEFLYTIPLTDTAKYKPWYRRFMKLRSLGVRAHSFTKEFDWEVLQS
jgi:hypothetical protein